MTGVQTCALPILPARELKALVDDLKKKVGSGIVAVVAVEDGKASVVVGVTEDLTGRLNAVDFVRVGVAESDVLAFIAPYLATARS